MLIWKKWTKRKFTKYSDSYIKRYKTLMLFGIIPLWISITIVGGD